MRIIDLTKLHEALHLLNEQLELQGADAVSLVVCGGSALIAVGLVSRTTRDVDVVAMVQDGILKYAEPLPPHVTEAAGRVAEILNLPSDWLNNGPASQFLLGMPEGLAARLHRAVIGHKLTVYYIDRLDQIYFKTFASADRGGYHLSDLKALEPTDDELWQAARWCMGQDVSEGFRYILKEMLNHMGRRDVSDRI